METKLSIAAALRDTLVIAFYSSLVDLLIVLLGSVQPSATGAQVVEAGSDQGEWKLEWYVCFKKYLLPLETCFLILL